ncbi:hypothetical protein ACJX0J_015385, partial [Zea mays]
PRSDLPRSTPRCWLLLCSHRLRPGKDAAAAGRLTARRTRRGGHGSDLAPRHAPRHHLRGRVALQPAPRHWRRPQVHPQ